MNNFNFAPTRFISTTPWNIWMLNFTTLCFIFTTPSIIWTIIYYTTPHFVLQRLQTVSQQSKGNGIATTWDAKTKEKGKVRLWIHHFYIMTLIHYHFQNVTEVNFFNEEEPDYLDKKDRIKPKFVFYSGNTTEKGKEVKNNLRWQDFLEFDHTRKSRNKLIWIGKQENKLDARYYNPRQDY